VHDSPKMGFRPCLRRSVLEDVCICNNGVFEVPTSRSTTTSSKHQHCHNFWQIELFHQMSRSLQCCPAVHAKGRASSTMFKNVFDFLAECSAAFEKRKTTQDCAFDWQSVVVCCCVCTSGSIMQPPVGLAGGSPV